MTDNEIKKALEYCKEQGITSECEKCNIKEDCRRELIAIALDLINRNEEMINGLIAGQETLQKGMAEKNAEIERLHKLQKPTGAGGYKIENGKVIFYSDMLNGYRHEYKDLEEIVKELNLYMHTDYKNIELISHYKHKAQTAKTEARKEFAERLKKKGGLYDGKLKTVIYTEEEIDNLLKEMEGETNGKQ